MFGKDGSENAVHASDSEQSAKREIDLFFKNENIEELIKKVPLKLVSLKSVEFSEKEQRTINSKDTSRNDSKIALV